MINSVYHIIVIKIIQCTGTKYIVKGYSRECGILSFVTYISKKQRLNKSWFQPLMQIEIECSKKNKNTLSRIKQVKPLKVYHHIYRDIRKQVMVMFLSEILDICLQEKEQNQPLYSFISRYICILDSIADPEKFESFHMVFMAELTKFLGFYPNVAKYPQFAYFDMRAGHCVKKKPLHKFYLKNIFLNLLARVLNQNIENIDRFAYREKQYLTKIMITYYQLHVDNFTTPKSILVIKDVLL